MGDLDRGDRAKRWRQWQRRWEHGEVMAVEGGGVAWFLPDQRRKPVRLPMDDLRPEDDRTTTTGTIARPYTHERPSRDDEPTVREVAERVRPRGEARAARKDEGFLDYVRSHRCPFEYLGDCEGPVEAHHFPPKRSGDAFGSDYESGPMCNGHHRRVTKDYRIPPLSRAETEAHMLQTMIRILAKWVMRKKGRAA